MQTVSAGLSCTPASGTLPCTTLITVSVGNGCEDQSREASGRIDLYLSGGQQYGNWRVGYLNLQPEEIWSMTWGQTIPALGTFVDETVFALHMEDVTRHPYNQPPYPPAGDTACRGHGHSRLHGDGDRSVMRWTKGEWAALLWLTIVNAQATPNG